jgi:hypothetical protein
MADDTQQSSGIMGKVGSAIGAVLPYALPAALGAALGGAGGGIAAAGMAGEGIQENKERQMDLQLKQQEMAMKWQQFGLESTQAQMAMKTAQSWNDYVQTLPESERAIAMENPQEYTKNKIEGGNWNLGLETLKKDHSLGADKDIIDSIEQMGPTAGKPILEAYIKSVTSGKFPNGVKVITNKDGTTSVLGIGPNGETTQIASGVAPSTLAKPLNVEQKNAKALQDFNAFKTGSGGPPVAGSMRPEAMKAYRDEAVASMVASGTDPEVAERVASSNLGLKPRATSTASDKLRSAGTSSIPPPPKELWGKTVTVNGKRYQIDDKGNAKPLEGGPSAGSAGGSL